MQIACNSTFVRADLQSPILYIYELSTASVTFAFAVALTLPAKRIREFTFLMFVLSMATTVSTRKKLRLFVGWEWKEIDRSSFRRYSNLKMFIESIGDGAHGCTHTHDESFEKIDYIEWVRHCVTLIESVHINLDACNDVCEKLVPLLTFHRKTCPHDTTHDGSFFLLLCFVSSRNNFSTCDFSLFTRTIYCLRILFIAHLICLHFSPFFSLQKRRSFY